MEAPRDGGGAIFDAYAHERHDEPAPVDRRESDDFVIEESVQPFATAAANTPFQPTAPEPIPAAPEPDFVAWHEQRAASGAEWEEEPVEEEDDGPTPHSDDDDDDGLREKPGFRLASDPSIHWRSGSKVSALDKCNVWCDAVVTDERGQGSSRQLRVHYSGWNKRFDEWLFVSGGRLRAPPSGAPRPLPSPRAPHHSRTAQARRAPPLITAVAIAIPASLSFGGAAPRHARPPAARRSHDFPPPVQFATTPSARRRLCRRRRRRGPPPPLPALPPAPNQRRRCRAFYARFHSS